MSDETLREPEFADFTDVEAPTERDPRVQDSLAPAPPRGVALSVLWWLEGEVDSASR